VVIRDRSLGRLRKGGRKRDGDGYSAGGVIARGGLQNAGWMWTHAIVNGTRGSDGDYLVSDQDRRSSQSPSR
jgi:hypothetical protein